MGAGFGGYWAEVPMFHQASGRLTPQQAHNDYLEVLASGGIVGVGLFTWFAIVLLNQARKALNATDGFQRAVASGAIIALVGVAVHSIVDFGLHITANALVFVALLAILSLNALAPPARPAEVAG
jgi:putative inorganic carbon (HCO3(-)) transporter